MNSGVALQSFAIAFLAVASFGCSPYRVIRPDAPPLDARAEPPFGCGEICVVHPHSVDQRTLAVRDNGALVGATRGPSYFCYRAEPGRHRLTVSRARGAADFVVAAGARQFVHQAAGPGASLEMVDDATGRSMLARVDYALLVAAPEDEELPTDPERLLPAQP
jgi:hypothetical protein